MATESLRTPSPNAARHDSFTLTRHLDAAPAAVFAAFAHTRLIAPSAALGRFHRVTRVWRAASATATAGDDQHPDAAGNARAAGFPRVLPYLAASSPRRATPHHIEDGQVAVRSESGRHRATGTTPGSRSSSPSKKRAVAAWPRSTACSADRSL